MQVTQQWSGADMARILVVDDEESVNLLLCDALSLAGHTPLSARHGLEALRIAREQEVDLLLLDINMPMADGFEVLERMRAAGISTPVIVLTARQDSDDTRRGFQLGADDFVRKPFRLEEVVLRVEAVLRRSLPPQPDRKVTLGDICIDIDQHVVTVADSVIELSPTEFRLLLYLVENSGRVVSRAQLLRDVWGYPTDSETKLVETYISYLRRKVGDAATFRSVRGVGYQLVAGANGPS